MRQYRDNIDAKLTISDKENAIFIGFMFAGDESSLSVYLNSVKRNEKNYMSIVEYSAQLYADLLRGSNTVISSE